MADWRVGRVWLPHHISLAGTSPRVRGVSFMAASRRSVSWDMVCFGKRSGGRNQMDGHAGSAGGQNNSRARSLPAILVVHAASGWSRQRMWPSRSP